MSRRQNFGRGRRQSTAEDVESRVFGRGRRREGPPREVCDFERNDAATRVGLEDVDVAMGAWGRGRQRNAEPIGTAFYPGEVMNMEERDHVPPPFAPRFAPSRNNDAVDAAPPVAAPARANERPLHVHVLRREHLAQQQEKNNEPSRSNK